MCFPGKVVQLKEKMRIHRCEYGQPWKSDSVVRSGAIDSLSLNGMQTGKGFDFWNLNFTYCPYKG